MAFRVGDYVNMRTVDPNDAPGRVVGFMAGLVMVVWSSGTYGETSWEPNGIGAGGLRHVARTFAGWRWISE